MPWPPDTPPPQLSPKLLTREDVINDIKIIVAKGLAFQKKLISDDPVDIEERRALLDQYPEEVKLQVAGFFKMLERVWPARVIHESGRNQRKRVSPEDIEELNLTPEQLKKLAGIKEME